MRQQPSSAPLHVGALGASGLDQRIGTLLGCTMVATAFGLIAWPLGTIPFAILCYVILLSVLAAGALPFLPRLPTSIAAASYALATVAVFGLVYQLLGATIDLIVFLFLGFGLGIRTYVAFTANSGPADRTRHGILVGTIGAAVYFVHDVTVGYNSQLPADAFLALGFTLVWWNSK